jgi:hypothetical protein
VNCDRSQICSSEALAKCAFARQPAVRPQVGGACLGASRRTIAGGGRSTGIGDFLVKFEGTGRLACILQGQKTD